MKKILLFAVAFILLIGLTGFALQYNTKMEEIRLSPRIYSLEAARYLVVELEGDPKTTRKTAGKTLYSISRMLRLSPSYMSGLHLDWQQRELLPKNQWLISYGKRVPETAGGLQDVINDGEKIYFERRPKILVAEILHLGPYSEIPASLARLRLYAKKKGYQPSGFYEEVYLKSLPFTKKQHEFETLLRYQLIPMAD